MAIDWNGMLGGDFVTIETGIAKDMVLTNWKNQTAFKDDNGGIRPGLEFEVTVEDKVEHSTPAKWTVTAKGALKQLKPLILAAEAKGDTTIHVNIMAVGEGKLRQYSIREV